MVRNVVSQLKVLAKGRFELCFVASVNGQSGYRQLDSAWLGAGALRGTPLSSCLGPLEVGPGDHFLGLDLAPRIVSSRWLQLLRWRRRGVRLWFVVYDMLPVQQPQWFAPVSTRQFGRWLRTLAMMADGTLCISRVARDGLDLWLHEHLGLPAGSVPSYVVQLGSGLGEAAQGDIASAGDSPRLPFLDSAGYVLMVGTIEPRKAHAAALDAFEALWADGESCALVIAGRAGWLVDDLLARLEQHPEAGRRLFWLNGPSDAVLEALYGHCKGLLMASHGEGFGLPVVEALQHGKPVLARDIPIFREIGGQRGMSYFDAHASDALRARLAQWLDGIADGTVQGFVPLPRPNWTETCLQMLQAMNLRNSGSPEPCD